MKFFYSLFIVMSIFIILAIILISILTNEEKKYNENLSEIKKNYESNPKTYFSKILVMVKRQIINHEFDKFEKDLLPIIRYLISQNDLLNIEKLLGEVKNYTHTYKSNSQMASPSDYIALNEKAWKIIDILENIIIN